jgi:hypothetical protein
MNTNCNPIRRLRGERNVFCTHYRGCLDHAIIKSWPSWDCTQCVFQTDQGDDPELSTVVNHTIAYYELPREF